MRLSSFLALALLAACGSSVSPIPIDPLSGTYCPVDVLTEYSWENPLGNTIIEYVPSLTGGGYTLALQDGKATPAGVYNGTFRTSTGIVPGWFTLPAKPGTYISTRDGTLVFQFPYPNGGPTWFWELAKHRADGLILETVLNDTTTLPGSRVYLHMTWQRCYPT